MNPETSGGKDAGPDAHTFFLSSLVSSTLVTLRMYIDREGWNVPEIAVNANMYQETKADKTTTIVDRDIIFRSPVDEEQKTRLLEIAKHCPYFKNTVWRY
jgi:putative redox protein